MRLDDDEESREEVSEHERSEIRRAVEKWAKSLGKVEADFRIAQTVAWRPHLYCGVRSTAIHMVMYPRIQEVIAEGFAAARRAKKGLRILLAGPEAFFRVPPVLEIAAQNEAEIAILSGQGLRKTRHYRSVFEAVYREALLLPQNVYANLANRAWNAALQAPRKEKGKRLEAFIAFMVSQVPGFRVVDVNHNTLTEEIDVVIENRRVGGIFRSYSEPLILAECKNQQVKAGKNEYVSFAMKIRNRRRAVSVGLFMSINGYTQDFRQEALRDSRERLVVATLERKHFEEWITRWGEDSAAMIENQIRAALLS